MAAIVSRRSIILAAPAFFVGRRAVAALAPTPGAAEGPFYPVEVPPDDDNDLVVAEPAVREAGGDILHFGGTVMGVSGEAIPAARVEIWQCDAKGIYHHPRDRRFATRDAAFQGFGHATSDARSGFVFRTIVPVPYPGRTPHIHLRVILDGDVKLTTQYYRAGFEQNAGDVLFRRLAPDERKRASMDVKPRGVGGTRQEFEADIAIVIPA